MVDKVSNVRCETPIVTTVFEEIEYRHGGMAEFVDKEGFCNAFCVVEAPVSCGQCLGCRLGRNPTWIRMVTISKI